MTSNFEVAKILEKTFISLSMEVDACLLSDTFCDFIWSI